MAATKKTKKKSNNDFEEEEEDDVDDQRQKKKTKTTKKDDDDDDEKKKTKTKIKKVALLKNILICGTPGTGKSTLAKLVLEKVNNNNNNKRICYEYVNVGDVCKAKKFYHSFDERLNSFVIDEDKILDHLEPLVRRGGMILDYHSSEFSRNDFSLT